MSSCRQALDANQLHFHAKSCIRHFIPRATEFVLSRYDLSEIGVGDQDEQPIAVRPALDDYRSAATVAPLGMAKLSLYVTVSLSAVTVTIDHCSNKSA